MSFQVGNAANETEFLSFIEDCSRMELNKNLLRENLCSKEYQVAEGRYDIFYESQDSSDYAEEDSSESGNSGYFRKFCSEDPHTEIQDDVERESFLCIRSMFTETPLQNQSLEDEIL